MEPTGSPQNNDYDNFHQKMRQLYKDQQPLVDKKEGNDHYVAAKLPGQLFSEFYSFCKARKWSRSTGVKYAIHQLFSEKP